MDQENAAYEIVMIPSVWSTYLTRDREYQIGRWLAVSLYLIGNMGHQYSCFNGETMAKFRQSVNHTSEVTPTTARFLSMMVTSPSHGKTSSEAVSNGLSTSR